MNSENHEKCNYKYRRFLSQFLATTAKNMILLNNGLVVAFPAILIAALTGILNKHNHNEFLVITPAQASWIGAVAFITKPIGSLSSGIITDPLGRKRSMILLNISYASGWYTLSQTSAVWQVFVGVGILGLSAGLSEPPVMAYLGEICEPKFRGILVGYSFWFYSFGMLLIYILNTLIAWRIVCFVCLMVPIISAIAICFIPETPHWYLSKNRIADAEKALRWLRGWVSSDFISQEFDDLQRYSERSKSCNACFKQHLKCVHPLPTLTQKFSELKRKQALKPMLIICSLFFFALYPGILSLKPYMVQIFKAYDSPISADKAVTIMSFLDNFGSFIFIFLVPCTGKRRLYLFCMSIVLACSVILTWFGFTYLPAGYISFDQAHREPFHLENKVLSYVPTICLLVWSHFAFICLNSLAWMNLSELFPFKLRGIGNGISSAAFYVMSFIATKTYYNLETTLSIPGVSLVYTFITLFGLVFMYKILPETENRTLEDIELHFSDNSKGITDRKIAITKHTSKNEHLENTNEVTKFTVSANDKGTFCQIKSGFVNDGFKPDQ